MPSFFRRLILSIWSCLVRPRPDTRDEVQETATTDTTQTSTATFPRIRSLLADFQALPTLPVHDLPDLGVHDEGLYSNMIQRLIEEENNLPEPALRTHNQEAFVGFERSVEAMRRVALFLGVIDGNDNRQFFSWIVEQRQSFAIMYWVMLSFRLEETGTMDLLNNRTLLFDRFIHLCFITRTRQQTPESIALIARMVQIINDFRSQWPIDERFHIFDEFREHFLMFALRPHQTPEEQRRYRETLWWMLEWFDNFRSSWWGCYHLADRLFESLPEFVASQQQQQ